MVFEGWCSRTAAVAQTDRDIGANIVGSRKFWFAIVVETVDRIEMGVGWQRAQPIGGYHDGSHPSDEHTAHQLLPGGNHQPDFTALSCARIGTAGQFYGLSLGGYPCGFERLDRMQEHAHALHPKILRGRNVKVDLELGVAVVGGVEDDMRRHVCAAHLWLVTVNGVIQGCRAFSRSSLNGTGTFTSRRNAGLVVLFMIVRK